MALTPEQIKDYKEQLKNQVQNLPQPRKSQALQQIDELSPQALEEIARQSAENAPGPDKTIYRMILSGEVPSTKIDEDSSALAVLEINPVSEGHVLIIPKNELKETDSVSKELNDFALKLINKIKESLKAKKVNLLEEIKFGEKILNLVPIYEAELTLSSPRKRATKEELEFVAKKILDPPRPPEVIKIQTTPQDPPLKIKRRIP